MVNSRSVADLLESLEKNPDTWLVDVRSAAEYERLHAPKVKSVILHTEIASATHLLPADRSTPIYLICHSGNRSGKAARVLAELGFTGVFNVTGGMQAWQQMGFPVESGRGILDTPV
jgi:rhodanese-related sulfurtransferase